MKSYTINLKRCIDRREYVISQLSQVPFIDNEFIEGVDGSLLAPEELAVFKQDIAMKRYGRKLKLGEIGCTMSHRRCFDTLLKSSDKSVIIFEDDILVRNTDTQKWQRLIDYIENTDEPTVILISGGWWSYGRNKKASLEKVYSAYYTHSYIINRPGAELFLSIPASYLADDWRLFRKHGLRLLAVKPHLVDQQWDGTVPSMIQNEAKHWFDSLTLKYKLKSYLKAVPCKFLSALGLHEPDSFDNFSQI